MRLGKILTLLMVFSTSAATKPPSPTKIAEEAGLCGRNERAIFQCSTGKKLVAVCGGLSAKGRKVAVYRYGQPGEIELEHSADREEASGFRYAVAAYSGGGEAQIYFTRNGFRYILYDRTIRTGIDSDGRNNPQFSSGLLVYIDNKLISKKNCKDTYNTSIGVKETEYFIQVGKFLSIQSEY